MPCKPKHPFCPVCKVRGRTWISGVSYECPKCGRFIVKGTMGYDEGMSFRREADQAADAACGMRCFTDGTVCGKFHTEECPHPIKSQRMYAKQVVLKNADQ